MHNLPFILPTFSEYLGFAMLMLIYPIVFILVAIFVYFAMVSLYEVFRSVEDHIAEWKIRKYIRAYRDLALDPENNSKIMREHWTNFSDADKQLALKKLGCTVIEDNE